MKMKSYKNDDRNIIFINFEYIFIGQSTKDENRKINFIKKYIGLEIKRGDFVIDTSPDGGCIELKNIPAVLYDITSDFKMGIADYTFNLTDINEFGIQIYNASLRAGDGFVFIPWTNIICFNSFSRDQINKLNEINTDN